tara:strand:+ start:13365 stop:13751 length:387 start_codon:yes stop_codon:yes gene_type:complete
MMRIVLQVLAVFGIVAAQAWICYQQIQADALLDVWGIIAILKWQILGQFFATIIAPDGVRFIAMALSSFVAAILALALIPAWITGVFPVIAVIALSNGEPLFAIVFVGLTLYVWASYTMFLMLKEGDL